MALIALQVDRLCGCFTWRNRRPQSQKPKRPPTCLFVTNVNASLISVSVLFARSHLQGQFLPPLHLPATWFEFSQLFSSSALVQIHPLCKLDPQIPRNVGLSMKLFICLFKSGDLSGLSRCCEFIQTTNPPSSPTGPLNILLISNKKMKTIPLNTFTCSNLYRNSSTRWN